MSDPRAGPAFEKPEQLDPALFSREEAARLRFVRWLVEHGRVGDCGPTAPAREHQPAA
jgi:hypothetical protein